MTFLRHLGRQPIALMGGQADVWHLPDGTSLLNLSGGPLVQSLAAPYEGPPPDAPVTPSGGVETPARERLEQELLATYASHGGTLWASSGSDAVEVGLWAAEWWVTRTYGEPVRSVVVRRGGYHGNTLLTRFLSTRAHPREDAPCLNQRQLLVLDEHGASDDLPTTYHPATESSSGALLRALQDADRKGLIQRPAILVVEPVSTTGHTFWPDPSEIAALVGWCRAHGITMVADEVASGTWRHGLFCVSPTDAQPHAIVLSKGLTCGRYPLAAVLLDPPLTRALLDDGQRPPTFTYALTETAAGWAVSTLQRLRALQSQGYFESRGKLMHDLLAEFRPRLAHTSAGLSASPTTLRFDLDPRSLPEVMARLRESGLWAYSATADFPVKHGWQTRAFLHLCPAFDSAAVTTDVLAQACNAVVSGVRASQSVAGSNRACHSQQALAGCSKAALRSSHGYRSNLHLPTS